ncbi:hypothetical protein [Psychrobacillus soli]|uniref:HNH endonuclease n=1 Tax=Psychrobacillus soli TaxID=1543965 RepID=A0A544TBB6_9BACI|nr:hypothetical protein [Psychrobacillus soli]TQR14733.1 hypothetical protein FG383_10455 [Psychrobacillus soli]
MVDEICYWCGEKAVSMEHVPPKCIFPEDKDVKEIFEGNFRKNLITVPACDLHNLKKSNLDEYLMAILSAKVGNNGLAYVQTKTKLQRSLKRNNNLLDIEKNEVIKIGEKEFPVSWVKLDNEKLKFSLESIARGLYFDENKQNFNGKVLVLSNIFNNKDYPKEMKFNKNSIGLIENERPSWRTVVSGENKKVFTYQFSPIDGFKCQTLILTFFERINIYVILNGMTDVDRERYENHFNFIGKVLWEE